MKAEIKRMWVDALRNGTFPQAEEGVLLRKLDFSEPPTFGTIGVLVELYRLEKGYNSDLEFWANCWTGNNLKAMEDWGGFDFDKPKYRRVFASIMQANTHLHQIQAVWIKKHLPVTSLENRLKILR